MTDTNSEKIKLPRTAKGKKPQYFQDPSMDKMLSMILTLMGELSVTRDRLDTVERLIDKNDLFKVEDIEEYRLTDEINKIRTERRSAYIARVLKSVQDEIDQLQQKGESKNAPIDLD